MSTSQPESGLPNRPKIVLSWNEVTRRPQPASAPSATREGSIACGICLTAFTEGEARTACPGCGVLYHEDCWTENLGCGAYGCSHVNALKAGPDICVTRNDVGPAPTGATEIGSKLPVGTTGRVHNTQVADRLPDASLQQQASLGSAPVSVSSSVPRAQRVGSFVRRLERQVNKLLKQRSEARPTAVHYLVENLLVLRAQEVASAADALKPGMPQVPSETIIAGPEKLASDRRRTPRSLGTPEPGEVQSVPQVPQKCPLCGRKERMGVARLFRSRLFHWFVGTIIIIAYLGGKYVSEHFLLVRNPSYFGIWCDTGIPAFGYPRGYLFKGSPFAPKDRIYRDQKGRPILFTPAPNASKFSEIEFWRVSQLGTWEHRYGYDDNP